MSGIEEEANKEDDPKDDGENGSDGIGNVIDRILDATDLGKKGCGQ
ncbi:hypothetical protein GCM10011531_09870 [Aquaticitalea lipolytica]|uniref:Uncharacterized protein n=1 Tax=Aquaticitalea lipolytica TaxID=1247562 RepID=A0A8J2XG22_9FLAO|nr:hypothetical protein GCM10011531_09870 [Aquaticitalea lipolytica]